MQILKFSASKGSTVVKQLTYYHKVNGSNPFTVEMGENGRKKKVFIGQVLG
jgi:hypothetical protein